MCEQVAGSLVLSTLVAAIPILVLFVLLAGVRVAAQWASLATLAVALVIAVLVYGMPAEEEDDRREESGGLANRAHD